MSHLENKKRTFTIRQERLIYQRMYWYALSNSDGSHVRVDWPRLAREIEDATGVHYPHESLRQNILPKNRSAGQQPRRVALPERLNALYEYLLRSDFIRESELEPPGVFHPAALGLQLFFQGPSKPPDFSHFGELKGVYRVEIQRPSGTEQRTLIVDYSEYSEAVHVSELHEFEDASDPIGNYDEIYSGWAAGISTCCLFFLRSERDDMYMHFLAGEQSNRRGEESVRHLALMTYVGSFTHDWAKYRNDLEEQVGRLSLDDRAKEALFVVSKIPVRVYSRNKLTRTTIE